MGTIIHQQLLVNNGYSIAAAGMLLIFSDTDIQSSVDFLHEGFQLALSEKAANSFNNFVFREFCNCQFDPSRREIVQSLVKNLQSE